MPSRITYTDLYRQVVNEIEKRVSYRRTDKYSSQLYRKGDYAPLSLGSGFGNDISIIELVRALQNVLADALPQNIIEGLTVEATNPISGSIIVKAGKGAVGGVTYELEEDVELSIPFNTSNRVFYITLFENRVMIDKTADSSNKKLLLAKIIVPNPGVTVRVRDQRDEDEYPWDAYIVNYTTYKLYGDGKGNFEEDTVDLLRDNISPILTDNLIGNLRLSENLKITNTQGTLELDSNKMVLYDNDSNMTAKFDDKGVYFYDSNGTQIARFSTQEARVGNISITPTSIQSTNFISGYNGQGFQIKDDGSAQFYNVLVRGKLRSAVFVKDEQQISNGTVVIADGSLLAEAIDDTQTNIEIEDAILEDTDYFLLRDENGYEYMKVISGGGTTSLTVERDSSGTGSSSWVKGTPFLKLQSRISIVSSGDDSSYLPYIDVIKHNSNSCYNDEVTKLRLGNLAGITDADYGTLTGYGLYSDNVFLKGALYSPDIKTAVTGKRIELNEYGFFLINGSEEKLVSMLLSSQSSLGDEGDVIIGSKSNNQYICYDNSDNCLYVCADINVSGNLCIGDMGYDTTVAFSPSSYDSVSWNSGTIVLTDGTCIDIDSGSISSINDRTFIYYDCTASSPSTLRTTTDINTATGQDKLILATVNKSSNTNGNAIITTPFQGTIIDADCISSGTIYLCQGIEISTSPPISGGNARTLFNSCCIASYNSDGNLRFQVCDGHVSAQDITLQDPNCVDCYSYLTSGALTFHDECGDVPYAKRICSGTACTGDTICLEGWKNQPNIMVGIKQLLSYDTNYSVNSQQWCVYYSDVECYCNALSGGGYDYGWKFDVHAKLRKYEGTYAERLCNCSTWGACMITCSDVCATWARHKFQLWCRESSSPGQVYYGCICYTLCWADSSGLNGGCCDLQFAVNHSTLNEIKSDSYNCVCLNFGACCEWCVWATCTALSWHASGFCESNWSCYGICRNLCDGNQGLSTNIVAPWGGITCNCYVTSCYQWDIEGTQCANTYCSYVCATWEAYPTWEQSVCFQNNDMVYNSSHEGYNRVKMLVGNQAVRTERNPNSGCYCCYNSHNFSFYDSGDFVESFCYSLPNGTYENWSLCFCNCAYLSAGCCHTATCTKVEQSICVYNAYLCQCYCVWNPAGAECKCEEFYSLTDISAEECILDPDGCLNWVAISYA